MACYPFCKWDDLQTYALGGGGQPTTLVCGMCGEVYEADATVSALDDVREVLEKRSRLLFSAMQKIKHLEDDVEGHLHYPNPDPTQPTAHLNQAELAGLREMLAEWETCRDIDAAQKEEDEKLSRSRRDRRMGQAFWTMPNPDRTDGKWK